MSEVVEKVKDVWVVYTNTDLTEGRGYQYPKYVCENKFTAIRMAKGQGVQGCDAEVVQMVAIMLANRGGWLAPVEIYSAAEEDKQKQKEYERQQEIEKQKAEVIERAKALGLSDEDILKLKA